MKKTGILVLAVILALGAMGVGLAHWSGTLDITGSVTTGTFGAELTQDNGVISHPIDDEDLEANKPNTNWINPSTMAAYAAWTDPLKTQDIGSATCVLTDEKDDISGTRKDTITITVSDAYPCYFVWVPVDVHCDGTVPILVWYTIDTAPSSDEVSVRLMNDPVTTSPDVDLTPASSEANAIKLHNCETARALIEIHCIQPDPSGTPVGASPGTTYNFTITIHYVQAQ